MKVRDALRVARRVLHGEEPAERVAEYGDSVEREVPSDRVEVLHLRLDPDFLGRDRIRPPASALVVVGEKERVGETI
jgi:hypothetical protein